MNPEEKNERSLDVQSAYAAGAIDHAAALAQLVEIVGNEDLAAEILGQIDGDEDAVAETGAA